MAAAVIFFNFSHGDRRRWSALGASYRSREDAAQLVLHRFVSNNPLAERARERGLLLFLFPSTLPPHYSPSRKFAV